MKIEKSNNPVAVGALVLVLVLIVGRIVWILFCQNRAVSAASTVAAPPTHTAPIPAPSPGAVLPQATPALPASPSATPETARNPFTCSVPVPPSPALLKASVAPRGQAAHHATIVHVLPLPPLPVWVGKPGVTAGTGQVSALPGLGAPPTPSGQSASAQAASDPFASPSPSPDPDPLRTLKLTAIVDGTAPMAVLQTAQPEPVVLHIGDDLEGMRVIAINENNVVFARGRSHWTLPLQSAPDNGPAGSASVNSVAVSEEKTDELQ